MSDATTETPEDDRDRKVVITYDPPGVDAQQWEFDPTRWTIGEVKLIEAEFAQPRDDFFLEVQNGWDTARVFLLWLVRRRTEPHLQLSDLDDLFSPYLSFVVLVEDESADDDPEPDGKSDPKDTSSGTSGKKSAKPKKQPASPTV